MRTIYLEIRARRPGSPSCGQAVQAFGSTKAGRVEPDIDLYTLFVEEERVIRDRGGEGLCMTVVERGEEGMGENVQMLVYKGAGKAWSTTRHASKKSPPISSGRALNVLVDACHRLRYALLTSFTLLFLIHGVSSSF